MSESPKKSLPKSQKCYNSVCHHSVAAIIIVLLELGAFVSVVCSVLSEGMNPFM